ncbi:MAG: ABC transporter ATP-binding protein [Spirochaeta sp.]|nr:ABC transporter ATP-binding protein [Spirochaeta sp.]
MNSEHTVAVAVAVAVSDLAKSYGRVPAVRDLTFTVRRGEIFGILGPNGSGKTSTLECVLGTRTRDAGAVSVLGMDAKRDRRRLFQRVGVQFQDSAWQPGIRTGEICETTAALYEPVPNWREMVARADLEKRIDTPVESLSGGERQKLSILLACIHRPELVFLDELTTGLDPIARRGTWEMIKEMQRDGTTVVLTSHFMDEVEYLCDRCIVLKDGAKTAEGSVDEVRAAGNGANLEESYIALVGGTV